MSSAQPIFTGALAPTGSVGEALLVHQVFVGPAIPGAWERGVFST